MGAGGPEERRREPSLRLTGGKKKRKRFTRTEERMKGQLYVKCPLKEPKVHQKLRLKFEGILRFLTCTRAGGKKGL